CSMLRFCVVFFSQAEDGIRDFHVTGVQTCALPILIVQHADELVDKERVAVDELMTSAWLRSEAPAQLLAAGVERATQQIDHTLPRLLGAEFGHGLGDGSRQFAPIDDGAQVGDGRDGHTLSIGARGAHAIFARVPFPWQSPRSRRGTRCSICWPRPPERLSVGRTWACVQVSTSASSRSGSIRWRTSRASSSATGT